MPNQVKYILNIVMDLDTLSNKNFGEITDFWNALKIVHFLFLVYHVSEKSILLLAKIILCLDTRHDL